MELAFKTPIPCDNYTSIAISAVNASMKSNCSAVVVLSTTGKTAEIISKFRPRCPIILVSRYTATTRIGHLRRAVIPLLYTNPRVEDWIKDTDERCNAALEFGKRRGFISAGDNIIMVTGWRAGSGFTNTIRLVTVE